MLAFCLTFAGAEPITTATLVNEMIDMHTLSYFPQPGYKTVQFSSYDRRSNLPGGPNWFANHDGFGGEPLPGFEGVVTAPGENGVGEYLICDVKGPGAIVRTWSAAMKGEIRMYLDNAEEPQYAGPAFDFFTHPYGPFLEAAGINPDLLMNTFRHRWAAYCPFAFSQRCRIIWRGALTDVHFYHINIRLYEPQAQVVTFTPNDLKTGKADIERVAAVLADPQKNWTYRSTEKAIDLNLTLKPGQTEQLVALEGPRAIERLSLKVGAKEIDKALRQTVLHIRCDDAPHGQVQSPIGDFFGAAPGINPFNAVPFTVEPDGTMTCRYVLPFARSCKILLENLGDQDITITGLALPIAYEWDEARSMHFRALWRVNHGLVSGPDPIVIDIPYLIASGKGVLVGGVCYLLNPNNIPHPGGNWWGEGDEKIFIDDDVLPSTFGTGSEDYYNYAWSLPDIFTQPFWGQPRNDGPANRGFVTNQRWHILDNMPFQSQFRFYMELWQHDKTENFTYARTAYHYARPGMTDDNVAITREDVRYLQLPDNWQPLARGGASNSVFFSAEDIVQEKSSWQLMRDNLWAGGAMLAWRPAAKDETITLKIPVAEKGTYVLHFTTCFSPASGRFSAKLGDQPLPIFGNQTHDGVVNSFVPYRTYSRVISTRPLELEAGDLNVTLVYQGSATAETNNLIGLDFIALQKR